MKTRLHLHGPPQVYPGSCPRQRLGHCSHCLTQQRTNRLHPLILLHATYHKNTRPPFSTRISLLILNTSQPYIYPPMQCSQPSLCSPAWKGRNWGVLGRIEITNVEVTDLQRCLSRVPAATVCPMSMQQFCCLFEVHGNQGGNSAQM